MTDDIVKRLQNASSWMRVGFQTLEDSVRTYDIAPFEAADTITALRAEVERLTAERDESHSGWTDTIALMEKASARLDDYDAALKAAEAERDRLRETVRFYASESLWDRDGGTDGLTPMERDGGKRARATLTTKGDADAG